MQRVYRSRQFHQCPVSSHHYTDTRRNQWYWYTFEYTDEFPLDTRRYLWFRVQYTTKRWIIMISTVAGESITAKAVASITATSVWSIGVGTILSTTISIFITFINVYAKKNNMALILPTAVSERSYQSRLFHQCPVSSHHYTDTCRSQQYWCMFDYTNEYPLDTRQYLIHNKNESDIQLNNN